MKNRYPATAVEDWEPTAQEIDPDPIDTEDPNYCDICDSVGRDETIACSDGIQRCFRHWVEWLIDHKYVSVAVALIMEETSCNRTQAMNTISDALNHVGEFQKQVRK